MHRTILSIARRMVFNNGEPMRFWGDAVEYAAFVLNRSPSRSNRGRNSPLELLEGKAPSLLNVVVFGSTCMVCRDPNGRTLTNRATRGIRLGAPADTKSYVVSLNDDNRLSLPSTRSSLRVLQKCRKYHFCTPTNRYTIK
jgi:hypothetical protein